MPAAGPCRVPALAAALLGALLAACTSAPPRTTGEVDASGAAPARPAARAAPAVPLPTSPRGGYYGDDGPPDAVPPGLEHTPDAVPRAEPLAARANRPYVVFGRSYQPMSQLMPYRERGAASWYGRKFHGQSTSNGEAYDMFGMSAAHPTLPLPSYVRVTNLRNGRSVVVRVNDRGPFLNNRLIDLSYAAAYKLGYAQHGSTDVEVESIVPGILPDAGALQAGSGETTWPPASGARAAAPQPPVVALSMAPLPAMAASPPPGRDAPPPSARWAPPPTRGVQASAAPPSGPSAGAALARAAQAPAEAPDRPVGAAGAMAAGADRIDLVVETLPTASTQADPVAQPIADVQSAPGAQPASTAQGLPSGLPPVRVARPVPPAPSPSAPAVAGQAFVQLGAFASRTNAEAARIRVADVAGASVEVVESGGLYKLLAGPLPSREAAALAEHVRRATGSRPFVVSR